MAERIWPSDRLMAGTVSAARAFSISGSLASSGSPCSVFTASVRTATSGENSLIEASAASSSPRIWLLLMTSSAVSGTATSAPRDRVVALAVLHHEDGGVGELDRVVGHGLDQRDGLLVGTGQHRVERGDARLGLADGQRARLLRRQGPCGSRQQRGSNQRQEPAQQHKSLHGDAIPLSLRERVRVRACERTAPSPRPSPSGRGSKTGQRAPLTSSPPPSPARPSCPCSRG